MMAKGKSMKSGGSGFAHRAGGKAMAGPSGAAPAEPGKVSVGGRKGNNTFAPDTGSGKMAGKTGAMPSKAC
jgi:hypothetical protein